LIKISSFTFNAFAENTYVLSDETGQCVIIDPGCETNAEKMELVNFLTDNSLAPVQILLTHAHIDHVLGNNFISGKYGLKIAMNKIEERILQSAQVIGEMWGIKVEPSPDAEIFLNEGDIVEFGNSKLEIVFTPGHSPGSICFYNRDQKFIIGGDVLFNGSIGRTDLPGGDYGTLVESIRHKLFVFDDDFKVYPGHGTHTTIGNEKQHNPFVGEQALQRY
jgi:glyoxylase-like metal-dependent hydrolase (beta-lactamase superfamily II)